MRRFITVLVALCLAFPLWALDPSEKLDDPVLEERARGLDHEIRCVQCQSEAVASSNANWAQDARKMIRERILAGDSDAQVKSFFVERYGEFVLMDPPKTGSNLLLWAAGPLMALLGVLGGLNYLRTRAKVTAAPEAELTQDERDRLKGILDRVE
ncbi:MAG: cytochrome c-type biogenesis protein [Paracoccaceae bacterium]